jgi:dihydroxy-acid dehydratase
MATRRADWNAPAPRYQRGYGKMFSQHVEQADKGCDFDFLRTDFGDPVPEPEIN